jgi:hypothetical protein
MSDWVRLFGRETSWSELQTIIEEQIAQNLATWQKQLDADDDLTPGQRVVAESLGAWKIRTGTRASLEAAWHSLQLEASTGTAVH